MSSKHPVARRPVTVTVVKNRFHRASTAPGSSGGVRAAHPSGNSVVGARLALATAVRYMQARPLGPQEHKDDRALFNADAEDLRRLEARDLLIPMATPTLLYHSLVLSPGPLADAFSALDLRQWTQQVMADLETYLARSLVWVGVVHRHNTHPHVHVLVGASTRQDKGQYDDLRFRRSDFAMLRESGDRWAKQITRTQQLFQHLEVYLTGSTRDMADLLTLTPGDGTTTTSNSGIASRTISDELADRADDELRERNHMYAR